MIELISATPSERAAANNIPMAVSSFTVPCREKTPIPRAITTAATNAPTLWHKGSFEHGVIEALAPAEADLVLDKNTSSAFNSTGIEWLLRNMHMDTLVVLGMATDMCVETTARDAADRGFNVIIVEDASATFFERHHRAALSGFARVFGQVWTTERVLGALAKS